MFEFVFFANNIIETEQNKTKKITCAPSEDSDQFGHQPSSFTDKKFWVLSYP